jgi:hypothetical protein
MRPADDLGYRARSWFWYWRVRQISRLSNRELDQKAFGDVVRKRHFERIQHSASSPDEVALFSGRTLLEVVDQWELPGTRAPRPFSEATAGFRSRLWEFLTRQDVAPAEYTNFIQEAVAARGWHRVHRRDRGLYREFLGEDEPALGPSDGTAYSAMLNKLVSDASPDSLALLIALFREAIHAVHLQEALLIQAAVTSAASLMCADMPKTETRLIIQLVDDRVLANVWLTEADWRETTGRTRGLARNSRDRLIEFRAWVAWYIEKSPHHFTAGYCSSPIVPSSSRIAWIESNRALLSELYRDICERETDRVFSLLGTDWNEDQECTHPSDFSLQLAQEMGLPTEASPRFPGGAPRFYAERPG